MLTFCLHLPLLLLQDRFCRLILSVASLHWQKSACKKKLAPETSVAGSNTCGKAGEQGFGRHFRLPHCSRHTVPVTSLRGSVALIPGTDRIPLSLARRRETQVQGPRGNLHLRGHSLLPGHLGGERRLFLQGTSPRGSHSSKAWGLRGRCNRAPPQVPLVEPVTKDEDT
jgi:hypothetical protein